MKDIFKDKINGVQKDLEDLASNIDKTLLRDNKSACALREQSANPCEYQQVLRELHQYCSKKSTPLKEFADSLSDTVVTESVYRNLLPAFTLYQTNLLNEILSRMVEFELKWKNAQESLGSEIEETINSLSKIQRNINKLELLIEDDLFTEFIKKYD